MKTNINDMLNPDDKLYLFYYLDHAISGEKLDEIRRKPFILWCCGKIVNLNDNDPFYFVISSGRLYRKGYPMEHQVIVKSTIIKKIELYNIPINFDLENN